MANLNIAIAVAANVGNAPGVLGGLKTTFTEISSAVSLARQALDAARQVIDATVTPTVALAAQQRDLARASGSTAEEAGTLIQVGDDLKVSYETLEAAAKKANAEGFQLNIATLAEISEEYRALPDSVSKAQFATDKFGRLAGPEMQKLLELSKEELLAMSDAALESGLVLSNEAVDGARDFEIAQDELNDALETAKVLIGQELIPVLTSLASTASEHLAPAIETAVDWWERGTAAGEQLGDIAGLLQIKFDLARGAIDEQTAAARAHQIAIEDDRLVIEDTIGELDLYQRQLQTTTAATYDLELATASAKEAEDAANAIYRAAEIALGKANIPLAVRIDLEEKLALASGKTTQEEIDRKNAVDILAERLAAGLITQDEYLKRIDLLAAGSITAAEALYGIGTAISSIPNRDIYVTTHYQQYGAEPEGGTGGTGIEPGEDEGGIIPGGQHGLHMIVPPGFYHDNFMIGAQSGEEVIIRKPGQGGRAGWTINIDARGAGDPRAVEEAGYRGAQRALREAGYSADARRRLR